MTDHEMLKLAAKAAGYEVEIDHLGVAHIAIFHYGKSTPSWSEWNPLKDNGDALRLAVKLNMTIAVDFDRVDVSYAGGTETEHFYDLPYPTDIYAATRRAIMTAAAKRATVRAAAQIGRAMGMTDYAKILRGYAHTDDISVPERDNLLHAADELEKLRAQVAELERDACSRIKALLAAQNAAIDFAREYILGQYEGQKPTEKQVVDLLDAATDLADALGIVPWEDE